MPEPTIAAGMVHGLFEFAISKGADPGRLAELTGLGQDDLRNPESRFPIAKYVALMRAGQKLCNDPALALHYAEEANFAAFSIVEMLTNASETMLEAFEQIARFGRLDAQYGSQNKAERLHLEPAGKGLVWIVDMREDPNLFPEETEVAFTRMVCGPRAFDQTPFVKEVRVTHCARLIFHRPQFFPQHAHAPTSRRR